MSAAHLSVEEVEALLRFVEKHDPIIVGGQSINIWAEFFRGHNQELDAMSPLTSKDIDFYHNLEAERALEAALRQGRLTVPGLDEHTPEAAVVTGYLGDKRVTIDFMSAILGVDENQMVRRRVTFSDPYRTAASITLMHPLDCVRSRLSNINVLNRVDAHSLSQARASLIILKCYIDDELDGDADAVRRASRAIMEIGEITLNVHIGRRSQTEFGEHLNFTELVEPYLSDERLDVRFRKHQVGALLAKISCA